MSKIRMNTELRNKLFNKIKNVFENEDTQEREAFLQARENVDCEYDKAQHHSYDIVASTNNLDEANDKLQGYRIIEENKNISFSILKYEKPLILTKEVA